MSWCDDLDSSRFRMKIPEILPSCIDGDLSRVVGNVWNRSVVQEKSRLL